MKSVIIVGGGASGLAAAVFAADRGIKVTVIEHEKILAKKLLITGKGRCNVTNDSDVEEILKNIPRNPRFMYSSLYGFDSRDTMAFFESLGVELKVERGKRVFPKSNHSQDIANALINRAKTLGVEFIHDSVTGIITENGQAVGVKTKKGEYSADAVIIATGGKSYPKTGSTGDGYRFAQKLGINVTELSPSLVPIVTDNRAKSELMGLSLRNVTLKMFEKGAKHPVYEELGEMLFTHFGVSGPLVLSSSAHMQNGKEYYYEIDLKPGLDETKLDKRILRDFSDNPNRAVANTLKSLMPHTLIPSVLEKSGISCDEKVNSVTREQRSALVRSVKAYRLGITGKRPIDEAIITRGGIDVRGIDPKTMESRSVSSLYFIGEVLDVDAYTGGFNLQIAFSTAFAAANSL